MAFNVEGGVDDGVFSGGFLKDFEVQSFSHRALLSREGLAPVFGPIVEPASVSLALFDPKGSGRVASSRIALTMPKPPILR